MTRCESYPPCFGTIYFPTAPFSLFIIKIPPFFSKKYLTNSSKNVAFHALINKKYLLRLCRLYYF